MTSGTEVVIGLDAGTTSAKAVAVNRAGEVVADSVSDPIATASPSPGASEQVPGEIWRALTSASRRMIERLARESRVVAIALAAQSGSVIGVDDAGAAVGPAITWMDTRSRSLVESWPARTREQIRRLSGWSPSPGLGLATIAWLASIEAAVPHGVTRWASVDDYLGFGLTHRWVTNPSNAAGMQLMDVSTLAWSPELCSLAGIEPALLSSIGSSGGVHGELSIAAAEAMGLPHRVPAVIGGHDQACAALGLGAVSPGSMVLSAGTAWVLSVITGTPAIDSLPTAFNLSPHVADGRWSASRNLGGLGAAVAWSLDDTALSIDRAEADLAACEPRLDDAFFVPSIDDERRTGWGNFVGDPDETAGAARIRAVFEACAFEVRRAVEQAAMLDGSARELTFVGGGTRSAHLAQTIADVLDAPITVQPDASWPAIGAARLAAEASGWNLADTSARPGMLVAARPRVAALMTQRYATYTDLTERASP
ncbi:MAG: FGGY-family carbohydrate kinase [Acidimicrobiia bacterium]|nr:FGGY-family carbohydrate kinase [Acidimicrobiia bacterium]